MLLTNTSIAILVIGEAFRSSYTRLPCTLESIGPQKEATISYVKNVFTPLSLKNKVDMFYTMSKCTNPIFFKRMRFWMPPNSHNVQVTSRSFASGWKMGYKLIQKHMKETGSDYDFIFQGRHDIMVPTSIIHWPSNFRHLLFEQEGRYCRSGCSFGGFLKHQIDRCGNSRICSADRFAWIPRKYFDVFFLVSNDDRPNEQSGYNEWGHLFLENFNRSEYGFLFPDCGKFASQLACDHVALYRPSDKAK